MIVDTGMFRYKVDEGWGQLPEGWKFLDTPGVAIDSQDQVYVFGRGDHPVVVFDHDGNLLSSWGEGVFNFAHMIRIDANDSVYCVDSGDHTVRKFTGTGRLLMTIGNKDQPSDTGCSAWDYREVKRGGPPFNRPTDLAFAPSGEIYISDGYGNARVHKFSSDGTLLFSWGEPGSRPGQFNIPHSICVDRYGVVYIADRENNRIQLFSPDGEFITQWTSVTRPAGLFIDANDNLYVTELGYRYALWPWMPAPTLKSPLPCVSIWNLEGKLLARWGGENSCSSSNFACPHGICTDSRGDLYVSEIIFSAGGDKGILPMDCHQLQKFVRIS